MDVSEVYGNGDFCEFRICFIEPPNNLVEHRDLVFSNDRIGDIEKGGGRFREPHESKCRKIASYRLLGIVVIDEKISVRNGRDVRGSQTLVFEELLYPAARMVKVRG